jgi:hypothetical protein
MISVNATRAGAGVGAADGLLGLLASAVGGADADPSASSPFAQVLSGAIGQVPVPYMPPTVAVPAVPEAMPAANLSPPDELPRGLPLPQPGKTLPQAIADGSHLPVTIMASMQRAVAMPLFETVGEGTGAPDDLADPAKDPALPVLADAVIEPPLPLPPLTLAPMVLRQTVATPASQVPDRASRRADLRQDDKRPAPAAVASMTPSGVTLTAADLPANTMAEPMAMPTLPPPAAARQASSVPFDLPAAGPQMQPTIAAPPLQPPHKPAMQDLTQIVERLAAAREAAAPATTQLAVDHAEFGPLSLSIEQGRTGELAIQVAAADSDSQAALVAALAQADLPHFDNAPERRDTAPEREGAMSNRAGEERGQSAGRDRFAGQPQSQARPGEGQRDRRQQPARHGEARTGTYA